MTVLAALGLGLLIGVVLGALGGGGSVLTVPALVFVLGLSAQDATTGSLVIVGVTAAAAAVGHARGGHVRWRMGALLALAGVPASVLATRLNRLVDGDVLLLAFSALMLLAATGMLMRSAGSDEEDEAPRATSGGTATTTLTRPAQATSRGLWLRVLAVGLLIGALTGFFGVGGGFVIVPALVMALRLPMPLAVGTSLLVIAVNAGVALLARAGDGGFAWHLIAPFTVAAVAASLGGKRIAERLPEQRLSRAFAVLLALVGCYVAVRAVVGLT